MSTPGDMSGRGDPRRDMSLQELDAMGPDTCPGCGAPRGTPHSPMCPIFYRGDQAWAKSAAAITAGGTAGEGDATVEHKMVSEKGKSGWRKG